MSFLLQATPAARPLQDLLQQNPGLVGLLILVHLVAVGWVISDVMGKRREFHPVEKLIWVGVALILSVVGAGLYYFVEKRKRAKG